MKPILDFATHVDSLWKELNDDSISNQILDDILKTRIDISVTIDHIPSQFGIYLFYIKPSKQYLLLPDIKQEWELDGFKNYSKIIKTQFENSDKNEEWIPFYIGKSEKVGKRIFEHLNHPKGHPTYGLKFLHRDHFKAKNEIQVGYWLLPADKGISKEVKQFIITSLESKLRKKLKPWIGKQ